MAITDNLVSYWKFDESSGNAADTVGSNTLTNANSTPFVTGKINNGADLESSSSQVFSITDASQSGLDFTGDMSISMWVKPESITGAHGLVSKFRDTAPTKSYRFSFDTTDIYFIITSNGSTESVANWTSSLTTGTFQHLVVTYNAAGGAAILYYNGTSAGTITGMSTSIANTTSIFRIGSRSSPTDTAENFFDGVIDEVGVWSKVLSGSEVTTLYNGGSGIAYPFVNVYSLAMDVGSYTFTGNDVTLDYEMVPGVWTAASKNSSTFTAQSKNSSTWTATTKS